VPPVISVDKTTTLRFAAIDAAGNVGTLRQDVGIDLTPPPGAELSATDAVNASLFEFLPAGTAHDYIAYFRGGAAGGITLVAADNDPESHIVSASFPDPGQIGDGWSGPEPSDPLKRHYDFTENATGPQPRVFTVPAVNGAGVAGPDAILHFIV